MSPAATGGAAPSETLPSPTPEASPSEVAALGVTFVSATHGWALLDQLCSSGRCLRIVETTDGGSTWTDIQPPPVKPSTSIPASAGVSSIRFADATDGWVFGPSLWSTHDDGATWNEIAVPGLDSESIGPLEVVHGRATAVGSFGGQPSPGFRIADSPTGTDTWGVVGAPSAYGAGPEPTAFLVASHGTGWYYQVDRVTLDGQRLSTGGWAAWQPPCTREGGPAVLAAASALELAAACEVGVWGDSTTGLAPGVWAFVSHDGGSHFAAVGGALPIGGIRSIAMASASVIVVAGYDKTGDVLLRSRDGGLTWGVVQRVPANAIRYLGFTTATQGVLIVSGVADGLLMTHDGGATWSPVHF